ncbi:hypothetical protein JG687_00009375, partial [Phytophthora cactorum]
EITNINMFSITLSASSFLPPTTTNLTLRNCNLFGFGFHFFDGVTNLQHLDLSSNSLTVPYAGSTTQSSCSNQFCAIETLNLTNNSLTTFPTVVLNIDNLQELYIAHNDITDFNISNSTFNVIQSLKAFESDLPDTSAICPGGTWQTAHSSKFCVANSTIAVSESSSGTCTQCITYVGIIGGCLIVALIVLLLWQRARSRRRALSASLVSSPSSYYLARSGNETVNIQISDKSTAEALLEDPVIITNRINYKEIKLGKCLSRGGFGLVFVGEYKGRQVAVKKIRPERSQDPKDVKAFLKEIILMAELHHPRIVEFIGVAWDNLKHISAVTEFMESGDLRNVLRSFKRQGTPLSWRNHKTTISLHIAEAMQYLHCHNPKVIHRDLKSKNVLLNMHLEAKLTDFGVSRTQYTVQTHAMTAGIGTSFWIAPEVLLGRDYNEQADIYSFGVVLSEIDTDDYPFWNDANRDGPRGKLQEADILRQVATGNKRPQFSANCPAGVISIDSPVAVCTMRWCVWLSLLLSTSAAQSSSSSSTSSSGSGSSNGSDAGATTKAEILAQDWFQANSDENVTYLAVGVNSKLSNITDGDIICGKGVPSLQRRTTAALPNNGCPAIFTALNGSCTCLPDYNTTDSWEFFVTKKTTEIDYPLTMNDTEVLPIDTIRTLLVPSTVVSLSITGVGDGLQSISFVPQDVALPGSNIPVAVNADDARDVSSITAVRLENIDMSLIVMNTGHFFPSTTLNLTMRNCGLETFGFDFFQGLKTVEYLDFSENNLAKPYAGNTISKTCTTQFCAVQILNLTGNQLTSFPSVVFNLDDLSELYIRNNNFTDFNVTTSVFNSISALRAYESDRPDDSATCSNGTWKAAHRVKFCVLNDTADTEGMFLSGVFVFGI